MATHSSILVWRIPWPEEPSGLCMAHGIGKSYNEIDSYSTVDSI